MLLESVCSKPTRRWSERESLMRPFTGALFLVVLEEKHSRAAQQIGQGAHDAVAAQAK